MQQFNNDNNLPTELKSIEGFNGKARYILGLPGKKNLVYMAINPSTANQFNLDATTTFASRYALKQGYDGWYMVNIYPQRATLPQNIHQRINKAYHSKNCEHLKDIFNNKQNHFVACWGNLIDTRPYFKKCLLELSVQLNFNNQAWFQLGELTALSHPRHPSRLAYSIPLLPFDMERYLREG